MDGGVGEAALMSAIIGGGSAAVTGGDPLKGALVGGLTGGVMGGMGALEGVDKVALGQTGADAFTASQTAAGNAIGASEGLSYLPGGGYGSALGAPTGAGVTDATAFMEPGVSAGTSAITPNVAVPNAIPDATNQLHGLDLIKANPWKFGMIGAGQALPGLLQPKGLGAVAGTEKYTGPLSKFRYDPSTYQPDVVVPGTPYQPVYAAGGGLMGGDGIAGLSANPTFPMADQQTSRYAVPSQMPVGANDVRMAHMAPVAMATGGLSSFLNNVNSNLRFFANNPRGSNRQFFADPRLAPVASQAPAPAPVVQASAPVQPNTNIYHPQYAKGGIADLGGYSDGGRMLKGPGDGMSDSIPASISGKQPARLADGEFVVPADVVSHLGNGSTDAGAKQLYKMMDKVRTARTGRKAQGKQINPKKYMPA